MKKSVKENEAVKAENLTTTSTSSIKTFAKIDDKEYEANAFVIDYRTAAERQTRLTELGRKIPEIEKKSGEARVIIEGRPYWVAVNFGKVFKGTRLHVIYQKDVNGEIYRQSITPIKPESK